MTMQTQGLCSGEVLVAALPGLLSVGSRAATDCSAGACDSQVLCSSECTAWVMLPCEEAETKKPCGCTQQLLYSAKPPLSIHMGGRDLLLQT